MNRLSKSRRNALRHFDRKNKDLTPDLKAVSEAIGTILLLAISVSLVGLLAVWVESLPEQTPTVEVDMEATMEDFANHIIRIDHNGGDDLDLSQIEIYIKIDGVTKEIHRLDRSNLPQFVDGYWSIGENWTRNIGTLHNWNASIPEVTVEVIDINADRIILSDDVQRTGELGNLPDLKISEEDISFRYQNETLRDGDWVNITARVYNYGSSDASSVIIRFFDGANIISNFNDDYCFIGLIPVSSYRTVSVNWTPSFFGLRTVNVKVYSVQLESNYMNNHASKKLEIEPTIPRITGPNLEIEDILFNPTTPTHGDWVTITVVVKNVGDEEVPAGRTINLTLWDEEGYLLTKDVMFKFNTTLTDNITQYETMQPPFKYNSQTTYGGKTKIKAEITADITESRYDDNYLDKYIQILPTILLVDDDGYFEAYSKEDVSSYMDAALQLAVGSGQFDIWWVKGTDGPKFSSGDKPLRNYDIVIWMTGYETGDTLTTSDQNAIKLYLENNGKLWLIGMNILEDLRVMAGYPAGSTTSFVTNYLGVNKYNITGTPQFLYGVTGENVTEGMELNTSNLVKSKDNGANLTLRQSTTNHTIDGILGNDKVLGFNGNMSLKYYNQTNNFSFKVVYFGWEFAAIIDMINRNNLTTQILKWFGWELEIGTDLAISSKGFSDSSPNFMDWITITASVRNNGPKDLTRVRVDFFIIDSDGRETRIPNYGKLEKEENPQYVLMRSGIDTPVEKKWLAVDVGRHTFRVVVDLEDEIEEVSEENNDDFYSPLFVTQLYIGYTILVVDDDNSTNNGGSNINATSEITSALKELGYFYDTIVVRGGLFPGIGPNITVMKHYNTVIWCTGYEDVETLLFSDRENLTYYFTRGFPEADFLGETRMNAWIIGQGILDDLGGPGPAQSPATSSFLYRYFRVKGYSTVSSVLPDYMDGVTGDNITHGIKYPMIDSVLDEADTITPTNDAYGIFWQDEKHTKYNTLRYNSSNYNIVFMPWIFSFINDSSTSGLVDESYKSELAYLILRWFQYPDERFELKTSAIDIKLSSYNPVLGSSYIIKTNVFNLGINDTNAIVRFLDGNTVINTKSIFVPSNGNSSTEVIWSPLFAGYRDIRIAVDPENDTEEVFDVLNNNATINDQIVYFFFDDMENGTSNWNHDSTILLLNAESPLEYMDKPVFSDVNSSWDYAESNGFMVNNTQFHSYNNSYFTYEPLGAKNKIALDIVMALDTSGSMGGTPISDLKSAASNFINNKMLDARDRVAIYTFRNEAPYQSAAFTTCDNNGKSSLNNIINGITASGFTPIWDTIGTATNYVLTQGSTRVPIVIAMTDGEDYGNEGTEDGSEIYCPWHEWGTGQQQYHNLDSTSGHDHFGCYGGSPTGEGNWRWWDIYDEWRYGLLNISKTNVTVFTVGLGLEHDNFSGSSNSRFPNGWMGEYARQSLGSGYSAAYYDESGTPEFNLWRIANTSGGDYFYAQESSQLNKIFQQIAASIVTQTTVQRALNGHEPNSEDEQGGEEYSPEPRSLYSSRTSRAQIFFDGFETGNFAGGPWSANTGWSVSNTDPYTGTYHAYGSRAASNVRLTLNNDLNLGSYSNTELRFRHYTFETESDDDYLVDASTDGGTSWIRVRTWDGDDPGIYDSSSPYSYYYAQIDLSRFDGASRLRIRFSFNSSSTAEGWLIDDVEIVGDMTGFDPEGIYEPGDRNLTTHPFSLKNVTSAKLSFYHLYNMRLGLNGVFVLVGTFNTNTSTWMYEYTRPTQPYTNNFYIGMPKYDDYGNSMMWCWNGISGNGKYTWDFIQVDLNNWTGVDQVRVRIAFLWASPGVGGGYFIDDFKIRVSKNESIPLTNDSVDQWELTNQNSHSGNYCWWNHNPDDDNLTGGMDNSLYTRPIDLTNARNATLSTYFKFNINKASGRPPDGFRVEISDDNGVSWKAINMGVRTAWGLSGADADADDDVPGDGKSYTGLDMFGDDTTQDGWVEADTLTRLNTDITGWSGSVIILRFRVVTASDSNPHFGAKHCEAETGEWKGFMVDDVIIFGYSLLN